MSAPAPDDKTLLGFLLGSLPDDEMDMVRRALENDPTIVIRLSELNEQLLGPLRTDSTVYEPSAGLVDKVLDSIDQANEELQQPIVERRSAVVSPAQNADDSNSVERRSAVVSPALSADDSKPSGGERRSWRDLIATIAASVIVASLILPSLLESRELSRRLACSDQMRQLGMSLASFGDITSRRKLPSVETEGPHAFAGMYAVRLNDVGLLEDQNRVWCPSVRRDDIGLAMVPTSFQLRQANARELKQWQSFAGGSYAYNLGIMIDGQYETPEMQGRSDFVILADAPIVRGLKDVWLVHSGKGLNLLFDDGHISFVKIDEHFALPDHPFFNRKGTREAGVDSFDSSLGPSHQAPFAWSTQK